MADMITKKATSVATTAYGKKLDTPISYDYEWTTYPDGDTLKAANDMLSIDEQVKVRNTERQSAARQKRLTAVLDAAGIVKPTAENDPQIALRDMFKTLQTAKTPDGQRKYTDEAARAMASQMLGVEWDAE